MPSEFTPHSLNTNLSYQLGHIQILNLVRHWKTDRHDGVHVWFRITVWNGFFRVVNRYNKPTVSGRGVVMVYWWNKNVCKECKSNKALQVSAKQILHFSCSKYPGMWPISITTCRVKSDNTDMSARLQGIQMEWRSRSGPKIINGRTYWILSYHLR